MPKLSRSSTWATASVKTFNSARYFLGGLAGATAALGLVLACGFRVPVTRELRRRAKRALQ